MSTTTTDSDKQFHEQLVKARNDADMSQSDAVYEIRQMLPKPMWISQTTLHRIETEVPEAKADPFMVSVLAAIYGVPTATISEVAGESLDRLRDLVSRQLSWTGSVVQRPQRKRAKAA